MKNKVSYVWRDVIHNFFSRRLIVVCVFQFTILHYYVNSVKQYADAAGYPAAPRILPFMGQNVYFQFFYGISASYFYSNVPFLQRYEMYVLMRQGRMRWAFAKLIRIRISAVMFAAVTVILTPLYNFLQDFTASTQRNGGAFTWGIRTFCLMKRLSGRPAESRKPWTNAHVR